MVEAGMKCIKYLLFAFNFIFVIAAIALIAVGVVVQTSFSGYMNFFNTPVNSVSILLIVVGVIMFFIAAFGCCGAIKENNVCTMVFAVLLAIIFIFQLAGGIATFVMRSDLKPTLVEKMIAAEANYLNSTEIRETWDNVQKNFECCGVEKYTEWLGILPNGTLPRSCCKNEKVKTCKATSPSFYSKGCGDAFSEWGKQNLAKIAAVGIALACIQIIGIVFACCLAHAIRKEYECV